MKANRRFPGEKVVGLRRRMDSPMQTTFSITKVSGIAPETVVASGGHDQPSANGYYVVATTGSTQDERAEKRAHLRLVQD